MRKLTLFTPYFIGHFRGLDIARRPAVWTGQLCLGFRASRGKPQPEDQLARIAQELEGLKKSISDLSMQQLAASNAALQVGQQELRQRISSLPASSHWYSDPAALRLRFALPQKPPAPTPAARAAVQETTATARRNEATTLTAGGAALTLRA